MSASFDYIRPALPADSFGQMVQEAIDVMDRELNEIADNTPDDPSESIEDDTAKEKKDEEDEDISILPSVGERIDVLWPLHNTYFSEIVSEIPERMHKIEYDDGDEETLAMSNETWRFSTPIESLTAAFNGSLQLQSTDQSDLQSLFDNFGNRPFMAYRSQGFPSYLIHIYYTEEEEVFKKTVKTVHRKDVPPGANVI